MKKTWLQLFNTKRLLKLLIAKYPKLSSSCRSFFRGGGIWSILFWVGFFGEYFFSGKDGIFCGGLIFWVCIFSVGERGCFWKGRCPKYSTLLTLPSL